jgi:hypothetical protein
MVIAVAIFFAKLLSPEIIILAGLLGWFSRAWWQIIVGAMVIAGINEASLSALQMARQFNPLSVLLGFAAAMAWAWLAFTISHRRRKAKAPAEVEHDTLA